ncbi:MAG: hypothetical protein M1833_002875 [Piccolia ochrophora]|nr:MAG: hypothetical protein M1833_002875 [Piccolia ochrophora]
MSDKPTEEAKVSLIQKAKNWGESPAPPTVLATLITAQHLRPPSWPLLFTPVLLFSSYLNLNDYPIDAAGINAAWSGLYLLLARRRKQPFMSRWTVRGVVRGGTMGMCFANLVGGGLAYGLGRRKDEDIEREVK